MRLQLNDNSRLEAVDGRLVGALSAPLTTLGDFEGTLHNPDRNDSFAATSDVVFEGANAAYDSPSGQSDLRYLPGTLPDDFVPGTVWFTTFYIGSNSADLLFGVHDTTFANAYELRIQEGGGTEVYVDEAGQNQALETPNSSALVYGGFSGQFYRGIIEWAPATYPDGSYDIDDTDGSHDGDFLITITTPDWEPRLQFFVDANDLTFNANGTQGGVGFRVLGGGTAAYDIHHLGGRGSFPEYKRLVDARPWQDGEIDHWQTFRLDRWSDDPNDFQLVDPERHGLPPSPAGHDHVVMNPSGTDYSKLSGSGLNLGIPEGAKAHMYIATTATSGGRWMWGIEDTDLHRMEARYDSGDIRYNNAVTGAVDGQSINWQSYEWYEAVMDRRYGNSVTWKLNDIGGSNIWSATVDAGAAHGDVSKVAIWAAANGSGQADMFASDFRQVD